MRFGFVLSRRCLVDACVVFLSVPRSNQPKKKAKNQVGDGERVRAAGWPPSSFHGMANGDHRYRRACGGHDNAPRHFFSPYIPLFLCAD